MFAGIGTTLLASPSMPSADWAVPAIPGSMHSSSELLEEELDEGTPHKTVSICSRSDRSPPVRLREGYAALNKVHIVHAGQKGIEALLDTGVSSQACSESLSYQKLSEAKVARSQTLGKATPT